MKKKNDVQANEIIDDFSNIDFSVYQPPKQDKLSTQYDRYFDCRSIPTADIAHDFLNDIDLSYGQGHLIRYWNGKYFQFNGPKWEQLTETDLKIKLNRFLQQSHFRPLAGTKKEEEIIKNLKSLIAVPSSVVPPVRFGEDGTPESLEDKVLAKNGIIDIRYLSDMATATYAESLYGPENFVLNTLNADFHFGASCPIWDAFLARIQPDPARRDLLQEMAGLLLVHDVSFQKFFILEGDGATGKTSFLNGIKALLGPANFTAVPLEAFSASRTFPLMSMEGKLANIIEDMSEIDRADEGVLKTIVSGGELTAEKKFRDPVTFRPTARLVFATNVLPRFFDRSNGLWRRIILIPFRQVIPPSEQDRKFADPNYWEKSGELSGMLNWAIWGLSRLMDRGEFAEPPDCRLACEEYKLESNPAAEYLKSNVIENLAGGISSSELYSGYSEWSVAAGYKPLSAAKFAAEVKRLFPSAKKTQNAVWQKNGTRERMWGGISWVTETMKLGNSDNSAESDSSEDIPF